MKWIFCLIATLAMAASHASSWETTSLRTAGGGLVRVGMPSEEARRELGQPASKNAATQTSDGKKNTRKEVLTYRGEDGVYSITLAGGQVTKIVVTPKRGY
jgi:hypothetical protein